jgi:phosphoribosyl 1,2-cyclic phosphodiesterase
MTETSDSAAGLTATFWGVRGSIPTPGPETLRYGGNTPCVEINCGGHVLILDAGTGLRVLGHHLEHHPPPNEYDIFLTHTHYDHVEGLLFFAPAFVTGNVLRVWAGHLLPDRTIREVINGLMAEPMFPLPLEALHAEARFLDFHAGETLTPRPGITLRTAPLNHPNRATGYRVDYQGRSICYITDTEHFEDRLDDNILGLIAGADYVIYDASFNNAEYPSKRGWGHSTWEEGLRLVEAAGAKTLVVFHHMPRRSDDQLDALAAEIDRIRPGTLIAREGMVLRV